MPTSSVKSSCTWLLVPERQGLKRDEAYDFTTVACARRQLPVMGRAGAPCIVEQGVSIGQ